ncbi:hypothetical protein EKD04_017835 [Chloroflexales bacterium ZM16-3]|nr:hypothetical protein [Chloroflexales bacterium ZM16-3]
MTTTTSLDAATRARLIREHGATAGLLEHLEANYEPDRIAAAFRQWTVEQVANRAGYDLAADPNYQGGGAAAEPPPAPAPVRSASRPAAGAAAAPARPRRSRSGRSAYRAFSYGVALAFALFLAAIAWRIDGFFGVNFLQRIPGLSKLPNTFLWPPVWTWLIGLGVSALQGTFWPHRAVYDDAGNLLEEGSTVQEIITWLIVLVMNIASSALGMMPLIAGMDLMGVVVPAAGKGLWGTAWFLAVVFAMYPEWATRVFGGRLWDLLVPDSIKHRIKAMKNGLIVAWRTISSLLPADPRGKMIVGGVSGSLVLIVVVWNLVACPAPWC